MRDRGALLLGFSLVADQAAAEAASDVPQDGDGAFILGYNCNRRRPMWTSAHPLVRRARGAACCKYEHALAGTLAGSAAHCYSKCERPVHEVPAKPREVLQLLRFRLDCHTLPSATGQANAGLAHATQSAHLYQVSARFVWGTRSTCLFFECTKLQHIRDRYARLFEGFDTMRFMMQLMNQGSQKDVMKFVSECLDCDLYTSMQRVCVRACVRACVPACDAMRCVRASVRV